jgi:hypothetical protein
LKQISKVLWAVSLSAMMVFSSFIITGSAGSDRQPESQPPETLLATIPEPVPLASFNPWTNFTGNTVYHTIPEMEALLFKIAADHSDIVRLESIGKSWQNRDIWAMKVSDNPNVEEADEPEVYFNSNHHAREWITIEIALYTLEFLTDQYATNTTVINLVNSRQIWVVPTANPDGRVRDGMATGDDPAIHSIGSSSNDTTYGWRKNMRDNNGDSAFQNWYDGVDLNRNYGYLWGAAGASSDPKYDTYGGPYPFSEPESAAIRNFARQHDFVFAISFHTYSQLILYPWGWSYENCPDNDVFVSVGNQMHNVITNTALSQFPGYTVQKSSGLYPTAGSDDDWLYGELGIYAYCIEAYPNVNDAANSGYASYAAVTAPYDLFHPRSDKVLPACQDNLPAILLLCQAAGNPNQFMDHVDLTPDTANIRVPRGTTGTVNMNVTNPGHQADSFTISRTAITGWTLNLVPTTMSLARNQTSAASLGITVPIGATPGVYKIWVNATSSTNASCKDSTLITVDVPYPDDVSPITLQPFTEMGDYPKGQYRIDSTVQNVGTVSVPAFNTQLTIKQLGVGSAVTVFQDDFEAVLPSTKWAIIDHDLTYSTSTWKRSTTQRHLGLSSAWCGDTTTYAANTIQSLQMAQPVSLERYNSATLTFWSYYNTERYYDFLMVEGSANNGKSWDYIARYDGISGTPTPTWQQKTLDLKNFLGVKEFKLRFRFTSDTATTAAGFYLDDLVISANDPTEAIVYGPVSLPTSGTLATGASQELSWNYNFNTAGTFLAEVLTLHGTDGNAANNLKSVMFYINNSRTLPEFAGIKSVTNAGMDNALDIAWQPGLQINDPLTYRVYRFTSAPTLAEVNAATPVWSGTALTYSDPGLTLGQKYYYVVRMVDALSQTEYNIVTLSGTPGISVDQWGPTGTPTVQTRYMRGLPTEAVVNGLTTYSLGTAQSATQVNGVSAGTNVAIFAGIRVYKRSSAGVETQITTAVSAIAGRTLAGSGIVSATWTPPVTTLAATDSIVVRIYHGTTSPPGTLTATWTTAQLGANTLDAVPWTVSYYLTRGGTTTASRVIWGTTTYNTNIANFQSSVTAIPLNHNTINWTASGSDVTQYNLYRSTLQTGPWDATSLVASIPAGTLTFVDVNRGQADTTYWWYVVRGENGYGVEETNANTVREPGGAGIPYNINLAGKLASSWVFVSYPVTVTGHIETVINDTANGDSGTNWDVAKTWDNQLKKWLTYRKGGYANTFTNVDNFMGLWLHITSNSADQALSLPSTGSFPGTVMVNLYTGWNLVGYPSATNRFASNTLPGQSDYISVWQSASPYIADYTNLASVTMSHGNAHWVYVTADCAWTVVNP